MPTPQTRPITRPCPTRSGTVVVRLSPEGLYVREAGRRTWYGPIPYGALLLQGARAFVAERKREQQLRRKARREARG